MFATYTTLYSAEECIAHQAYYDEVEEAERAAYGIEQSDDESDFNMLQAATRHLLCASRTKGQNWKTGYGSVLGAWANKRQLHAREVRDVRDTAGSKGFVK